MSRHTTNPPSDQRSRHDGARCAASAIARRTCRSKRRHDEENYGGHKDGRLVNAPVSTEKDSVVFPATIRRDLRVSMRMKGHGAIRVNGVGGCFEFRRRHFVSTCALNVRAVKYEDVRNLIGSRNTKSVTSRAV